MLKFVVPKFATFYTSSGKELPTPTKIVMAASDIVTHYWWMAILGFVAFRYLWIKLTSSGRGKLKWGEIRFRVPIFGPLSLKIENSRFCHIMAALYKSGLPINRALEISGRTLENAAFIRDIDLLKAEVVQGGTMSDAMAKCRYFPTMIVDAAAVGEKTGALDEMMEAIAGHYDLEIHHTVKNLSTLIEPLMLFAIGGVVLLLALAMFLPMWSMGTT